MNKDDVLKKICDVGKEVTMAGFIYALKGEEEMVRVCEASLLTLSVIDDIINGEKPHCDYIKILLNIARDKLE